MISKTFFLTFFAAIFFAEFAFFRSHFHFIAAIRIASRNRRASSSSSHLIFMLTRAARKDKLRALREARKGKSILLDDSDAEESNIYDEVDENTYREHKRDQLMNDDFIVDDDGEGYVDNGEDEWDENTRPKYYSDEEDVVDEPRKRKEKPVKVTKTAKINTFFKTSTFPNLNPTPAAKPDAKIDDILDDFEGPATKKFKFSTFGKSSSKPQQKTKPTYRFATSMKLEKKNTSSDVPIFDDLSSEIPDQPSSPVKTKTENEVVDISDDAKEAKLKEEPKSQPESDSEDEVVVARRPKSAVSRTTMSTLSAVSASQLPSSSPVRSQPITFTEKVSQADVVGLALETDGFKMFWLDYCEVDSSLLLFGKVLTKEGKLVSGVVQVNGISRELYFLPREFRKVDGMEDTEQPVTTDDVYHEIAPHLLSKFGLEMIRAKKERMKYAFELSGIPRETDYLKILLPFKTPKSRNLILPSDLEGETFRHVFGTNASIFESFVLQQNIMGPCWLDIKGGNFEAIQNTSHCQVEVAVDAPKAVTPISGNLAPPNLTVSAISVQTTMNVKENKQEVVSVSIATYRDLPQDAPIDDKKQPDDMVTLVRPVGSVNVPAGLEKLAKAQGLNLRILPNEKTLLNCLSAIVKNLDPDVYIGHRLENISLDVLVHRMYDLKVTTWSTFGRRNRKVWPDKFGKSSGFSNNLHIREIFQGRLLCDIANEMGQSLTTKCQSWDLSEMLDVVCHKKHSPLEINFSNPRYAEDASFLLMALKENASNVNYTAEIAFAIQILSLSKQLTNIAGNAWSHTLSGTRAGRNEFILLHEFHRNKYIVPDKEDKFHKNSSYQQEAKVENNEDDSTTVTSNKKPKYQGGLVFEPEKGLHKNYILVMDFNSLYPSIIQEYNICFTTVDRDDFNVTHDEEKDMPVLPDRESVQGVLPRLLNTLVSRRREVKKLLKDPKNSVVERVQYDIKQQALKLTANSMYGCLGYVNSRFYAKPLAMLVTNKGREILMDTRQLAESIGLRVVYGDTDSVMIDTGVTDFKEAIKIGEQFKLHVNERYKLLEIDIDNVFKRLLLHAKKKYAAMNASIDRKTGEEKVLLEVKGLDMRRREYCQLSKEISTFILEKILADSDPEQALMDVYDYLEEMSTKIKNGEIPVNKFKINTRLSKDPNNYPNGKTMPPVRVAMLLRESGKVIKAGTVITFVITAPQTEDEKSTPADRARPIQDVLKKDSIYRPDPNYYLEKQIFAPVERLLERIEGIDMMRVASSLDIDTKKYVLRVRNSDTHAGEIVPLESNISDVERFRQCSYLVLKCKCGTNFRFGGIVASNDYKVTFNGICCNKCQYTFPTFRIAAQLENMIRRHISLYYAGWLVCDDGACGITTRQISVYGKRCIGAAGTATGCKGVMRYKYSDRALYNQLLYFSSIFDVDKARKSELRPVFDAFDKGSEPAKLASGQIEALAEQNREHFGHFQGIVDRYLAECGRRYVNMGSIFDFMK